MTPARGDRRDGRRIAPGATPPWAVLAALGVLAVLLAGAAPAAADTTTGDLDADALGLQVTAGWQEQFPPGAWAPVTVRLAPEAPFAGRLLVASTSATGTSIERREIEVGARVEKRYDVLVPPSSSVQVQLVEAGSDATVTVRARQQRPDGFLVGLLGEPAGAPPPLTSAITQERAIYVGVDAEHLDLGPLALDGLATVVVSDATLRALPEEHVAALSRAVADGLQLVVTEPTDPDLRLPWRPAVDVTAGGLEAAPGAWAATPAALGVGADGDTAGGADGSDGGALAAATRAGRGRVAVSTVALGAPGSGADAAYWEALLQPGRTSGGVDRTVDELQESFRSSTGGGIPSVGLLAVFLLAYVVVVGPVVGVVLSRRGRTELAWVVIPAVTALFAGAGVLGAAGARPAVGAAGRAAYWIADAGTTVTTAAVRSPQAGSHTVTLPGDGWTATGASWGGRAQIDPSPDATRVELSVESQAFGAVVARRAVDTPPPLDVEAAIVDGALRLEATNVSDVVLTDVTVRLATFAAHVAGKVEPGQTLVETVELPDELPLDNDPLSPWGAFRGPQNETDPASFATLLRWDQLNGDPGLVWVTATTDGDLGLGVPTIDDAAPVEHGTFVAVAAPPAPTDDVTGPFEVQRDLLLGAGLQDMGMETPQMIHGSGTALLRFRLPREADLSAVAFDLGRGQFAGNPGRPVPLPDPAGPNVCREFEITDGETGEVIGGSSLCGQEEPTCPPDAISCVFDGDVAEICFEDRCEIHTLVGESVAPGAEGAPVPEPLPPEPLQEFGIGLQIWDHADGRWVDLAAAGLDGSTSPQVDRWVSPLGDVWVRATGDLFPFDIAGRSVWARTGGDA